MEVTWLLTVIWIFKSIVPRIGSKYFPAMSYPKTAITTTSMELRGLEMEKEFSL